MDNGHIPLIRTRHWQTPNDIIYNFAWTQPNPNFQHSQLLKLYQQLRILIFNQLICFPKSPQILTKLFKEINSSDWEIYIYILSFLASWAWSFAKTLENEMKRLRGDNVHGRDARMEWHLTWHDYTVLAISHALVFLLVDFFFQLLSSLYGSCSLTLPNPTCIFILGLNVDCLMYVHIYIFF